MEQKEMKKKTLSLSHTSSTFLSFCPSRKLDIQVVSVPYLVHNETLNEKNDHHFYGIYKLHISELISSCAKQFRIRLASATMKWLSDSFDLFVSHNNVIASCRKEEFSHWMSCCSSKIKILSKQKIPKLSGVKRHTRFCIKFFLFILICVFKNICSDLV